MSLWTALAAIITAFMASRAVAQLLEQQDIQCSFTHLGECINVVRAACGASTAAWSLDCGLVFVPFFTQCHTVLSNIYDKEGADKTEDGTSTTLSKFAVLCDQQDPGVLTARIVNLTTQQHCAVDTSQVYAVPNVGTTPGPKNYHDDGKAMKLTAGVNCVEVKQQRMCGLVVRKLLSNMCQCACPPQPGDRRIMFG